MNPETKEQAAELARSIEEGAKNTLNVKVAVAPPFPFLSVVKDNLSSVYLAAQDVSHISSTGAHTGEVSAIELKSLGVFYVIVGHSERRAEGETDEEVAKKLATVLEAGLTPVLAVGEPKPVRDKGLAAAKKFVKNQLTKDLSGVGGQMSNVIIAYEPIWAISTNPNAKPAEPKDAAEIISYIKELCNCQVLYGGSTDSKNIRGFLSQNVIDGALVGGASLKPKEFIKMVEIASEF